MNGLGIFHGRLIANWKIRIVNKLAYNFKH